MSLGWTVFRTLESTRPIRRGKCGKSRLPGEFSVCVFWGGGSLKSSGSGQIPGPPRKLSRATCIQDLKLPRQGWQRAPGQVTACESLAQLLLSPTLPGRNASLQGQKTDLTTGGRRLRQSWAGKANAGFPWHSPGLGTQSLLWGLMGPGQYRGRNRTRRKDWSRTLPLPGRVRGHFSKPERS